MFFKIFLHPCPSITPYFAKSLVFCFYLQKNQETSILNYSLSQSSLTSYFVSHLASFRVISPMPKSIFFHAKAKKQPHKKKRTKSSAFARTKHK